MISSDSLQYVSYFPHQFKFDKYSTEKHIKERATKIVWIQVNSILLSTHTDSVQLTLSTLEWQYSQKYIHIFILTNKD